MNNKLEVIGIDHGWSMMKTISQVFVTGVKDTDYCAAWCDCMLHNGRKQNGQSYNGYLLQIFSFVCI